MAIGQQLIKWEHGRINMTSADVTRRTFSLGARDADTRTTKRCILRWHLCEVQQYNVYEGTVLCG
jgi:hypothetical protein